MLLGRIPEPSIMTKYVLLQYSKAYSAESHLPSEWVLKWISLNFKKMERGKWSPRFGVVKQAPCLWWEVIRTVKYYHTEVCLLVKLESKRNSSYTGEKQPKNKTPKSTHKPIILEIFGMKQQIILNTWTCTWTLK